MLQQLLCKPAKQLLGTAHGPCMICKLTSLACPSAMPGTTGLADNLGFSVAPAGQRHIPPDLPHLYLSAVVVSEASKAGLGRAAHCDRCFASSQTCVCSVAEAHASVMHTPRSSHALPAAAAAAAAAIPGWQAEMHLLACCTSLHIGCRSAFWSTPASSSATSPRR